MTDLNKHISPVAAAVLIAALLGAIAPAEAALPADTPQYKCFIRLDDGSDTIIRFYSTRALPERFDEETAREKGAIPSTLLPRVVEILECAADELQFRSREARRLERSLPQ